MNEKIYLEYLPEVKSSRSFSRQQITSSITESLAQTCRIACGIVGLSNAAGEACNTEVSQTILFYEQVGKASQRSTTSSCIYDSYVM
ncbi:unnamed protein product [Adineta steineri]|uniref:Uncharacterized protein n=1 Tax=Adineta steineri TaxID=433720 RepID=A0A820BR77_9BILA|nr:unnamed protein product [Adineta steineri]